MKNQKKPVWDLFHTGLLLGASGLLEVSSRSAK